MLPETSFDDPAFLTPSFERGRYGRSGIGHGRYGIYSWTSFDGC